MPVIGGSSLSIGKASAVNQPAGLAFLKRNNAPADAPVVPVLGYIPIIRGLFWVGGKLRYGWNAFLESSNPIVRFIRFNTIPQSVPKPTIKTVALDTAFYLASFLFGEDVINDAKEVAKVTATGFYNLYTYIDNFGNATVVFTPENHPMIDLMKWDP